MLSTVSDIALVPVGVVGLSHLTSLAPAVYRKGSKPNINFITSTQDALRNVASVSAELRTHFALPATGSLGGISPVAAHLNILYHHVCLSLLSIHPICSHSVVHCGCYKTLPLLVYREEDKIIRTYGSLPLLQGPYPPHPQDWPRVSQTHQYDPVCSQGSTLDR